MKVRNSVGLMLALTWAAGLAVGDDNELSRKTLVGIRGVFVLVEPLEPEIKGAGLTETVIQTDAELKLRLAGIPVLTREEALNTTAMATLYINANVLTGREPWSYNLDVELQQQAILLSNNVHAAVTTWDVGSIGSAGSLNVSSAIRGAIKDRMDQFVNAYLSANPKK